MRLSLGAPIRYELWPPATREIFLFAHCANALAVMNFVTDDSLIWNCARIEKGELADLLNFTNEIRLLRLNQWCANARDKALSVKR